MKKISQKLCCICLILAIVVSLFTNVCFASQGSAADELNIEINQTGEIDFSPYVSQSHPRLYFNTFDGVKERYISDPVTAQWYNALLAEAKSYSDGSVSEYNLDELTSTEHIRRIIPSQDILAKFYVMSLATACEDNKNLADRLWLEVEAAINLPNWHPGHWLETAEMMHSVAIAYDWCYKFWTDEQKALMEDAIVRLGLSQATREYAGRPRWYKWVYGMDGTKTGTNWTVVCNTGVLMASLALYEKNDICNTMINNAVRSMKNGLNAYSANGSFRENLTYWNYATRNLIMATSAFENAIGGDFKVLPPIEEPFHYDFTTAPGISITPDFPIYANGPAGVFNYGDATGGNISTSPAFMWLGNRFNNPHYTKYYLDAYENRAPGGINLSLALLWYNVRQSEKTLPKDKMFEENFVSMRSSWDSKNSFWIALKGGINGKGHNHYDLGTFALDYGGVRFAKQLGGIDYESGNRSRAYKGRTEGQNTILINPDETVGQHTTGVSEFETFYFGEESSYAILDMTDAYSKKSVTVYDETDESTTTSIEDTTVTSARRGVKMFSNKNRIVVQDEVKMNAPSEFYWFMHTAASIRLFNNNKSAVLTLSGKTVYFNLLSDVEEAQFEVMESASLPSSPPYSDKLSTHGNKLAVHLENIKDITLAVEMVPFDSGEPSFTNSITSLDNWHPESDVEREGTRVNVFGVDKPGRTVTMITRSPLGEIVAIDQKKVDALGEYTFGFDLPENHENGIYSVFVNGELYKLFDVTDGYDAGEIPVSYSISYELPAGFTKSVVVAAEYSDGTLVQLTEGNYNHMTMVSTVVFDRPPQKGNTIKFLFLEDLSSLTPLYPTNEIIVK